MSKVSKLTPLQKRRQRGAFSLLVLSLGSLIGFGLLQKKSAPVTYKFVLEKEWIAINEWTLDSRTGSYGFSFAALLFSIWAIMQFRRNKKIQLQSALGGSAILMAFLCWAASGKMIPFTGLLQGALLLSVPLIFGAMAGVLCERSGVINIAIEGQLLAGAFAAGVVASLTQNTTYGLLVAPLAGALIPILSKIPLLGPIFFNQTIIVYLMYLIVAVIHFSLFKTRWGLRTRAIGEHPTAADSVGIKVNKLRFRNVIFAGLVAGLGGAYFTVGAVGAFGKEMTAGKGFIALAALIFGRWSPVGAVMAALLFGFADNLQGILSITGTPIPSEFMLMAPYIATIIAVTGFVGRVRAPAADGIPYNRGGSH